MTDEPTIELDQYTEKYLLLRAKRAQLRTLAAEVKRLEEEFRELTGKNHVAQIGGVDVFTNRPIATFRGKEFREDHPLLAKEYTKPVIKDELDVDALKRDHPALYAEYQTRQFRILEVD